MSSGVVLAAGGLLLALDPAAVSAGHLAVGVMLTLVWAAAAVTIARLAPGNLVGPLAGMVALSIAVTTTRELLWQYLAVRPASAADATWLMAALRESAVWLLVGIALLLLLFPDGRLPSSRWRIVPPALVTAAAAHHAWGLVDPTPFRPPLEAFTSPFGPPGVLVEGASVAAFVFLVLGLLACAVSPFVRSRGADHVRRAQLRWLAVAGLGVPGFMLVCLGEILVTGEPRWASLAVGLVALAGLPVAIAIAILRRDLFDVDRALTSAVTCALLSLVLGLVFAGAVLAGGLLLGRDSVVTAVAATAVTAAALSPVRSWLQRAVDRRLYPRKEAALVAIAELQRRIHDGHGEPEELQSVLREALRDPDLRVGCRGPAASSYLDAEGRVVDPEGAVPVLLAGEPIGVLRPGGGPASAELLRSVASAGAVIVEVVRLRRELASALREVENSRSRMLHAGDEERRRIERDLHDGSQQRLVSLGMALRVAQRQLSTGEVDVAELLDQTVAELGTAVAELRQLAQGLRPSNLDEGLHPALASLAHRLPVSLVLDVTDEPLPDQVATTLYFLASEAITNAVKHANASRIDVRVVRCDGRVHLSVSDDGCGGATHGDFRQAGNGVGGSVRGSGSGLLGLSDRVATAGGQLALQSPRGGGTVIEVELPCGS
jgi:signal transduction histidine kinase